MVTIDLRDQPVSRMRDVWPGPGLFSLFSGDPALMVLHRALAADLIAASLAVGIAMTRLSHNGWSWALLPLLLWPLAMWHGGAGNRKQLLNNGINPGVVLGAACWVVVAIAVVGLVLPSVDVRMSLRFVLLLAAATWVGRWFTARWLTAKRMDGQLLVPVLARGRSSDLRDFARMLARDPNRTMDVVAVQCTDRPGLEGILGATRIPSNVDTVDAAARNRVSSVVIVGPTDLGSDVLRRSIWRAGQLGIDTWMLPIVEPVAPPQVAPVRSGGPASMVYQGPNRRLFRLKMVLDRVLAAFGLLLISPLLIGIGIAIKATSPGPVFFRQTRVGREGRNFTMIKFRTMCVDAEDRLADLAAMNEHAGGTLFKIRQDPRVTSVGRVLRKFSLDELPQLINVVRGEMSLVGPRPPLPEEVANYPIDARRRLVVNPGLTGLWQVSGRSNLDPEESARLDTQYVEHWTFGMDLRILAKTAKVVVTGSGAY